MGCEVNKYAVRNKFRALYRWISSKQLAKALKMLWICFPLVYSDGIFPYFYIPCITNAMCIYIL